MHGDFPPKELKELLKAWNGINVKLRIAEVENEYVALADLIAGASRKGLISAIKPNIVELAIKYFKK